MKKYFEYGVIAVVFLLLGIIIARTFFYNEQNNIENIVSKNYDAVVSIETYNNEQLIANGSGFIYKIDNKYAYIITNNHVIENSDKISIITEDDKVIEANIVGTDIISDIAVLLIDKKYATNYLILGSSNSVNVGQTVITMSTPINKKYSRTITSGIISGKNRKINAILSNGEYIIDSIQIDAPINSGSSGGAVLDLDGKVVGIIYSKLENNIESIGFMIPISNVKNIINTLEKGKKVNRPYIGIEACNSTDTETLNTNGLEKLLNKKGVVVLSTKQDSPLEKAGLKKGDIIISINNEVVENTKELKFEIYKYKLGDKVKLTYYRNNEKKQVTLEL